MINQQKESIEKKAIKGSAWAFAGQFSNIIVSFSVNLILARLLLPSDYGLIGMLTIFIALSQTFIDSGFGSALIQKKSPDIIDYSTIFYWNLTISVSFYAILFLCAPLIAEFYNIKELTGITRGIGLVLILNALITIQSNILRKQLRFKALALINIFSSISGGLIAIIAAYNSYGVYSLVLQPTSSGLVSLILIEIVTHWRPALRFSRERFNKLFHFGGFLFASTLLQTGCQNIINVLIGRTYNATQLGLFSQAQKFDSITSHNIPQVLAQVLFPVFSAIQDDVRSLGEALQKSIRIISFVIFPILIQLILIAEPLISFLYGSKWIDCVPYFKILCIGGLFVCLQNISYYAVAAVGKSKVLFYWSFYKWGILLLLIFATIHISMDAVVWGLTVSNINIYLVNTFLASRYTQSSFFRLLRNSLNILIVIVPSIVISELLLHYDYTIVSVITFWSIYILTAKTFHIKALTESIWAIKKVISRK